MKRAILAGAASALALMFWASSAVAQPLNPKQCALHARAAADNDLRLDEDPRPPGRPVPIPPVVAHRIHQAAIDLISRADAGQTIGLTCDYLFRRVSRVSEFGGRQLYVAEVVIPPLPDDFFLVLYDPASGRATASPPKLDANWAQQFGARDSLIKWPLVSSTRRLGGDQPQIVFEQRVHNGTLYNAVIYHYFEIGPQLQLTPVLAVEARTLDPMPIDDIFVREVQWLGPDRIRLKLFRRDAKGRRKPLGYATLARSGPGHPFRVLRLRPRPDVNRDGLITFCEQISGDDFQKRGCEFYK